MVKKTNARKVSLAPKLIPRAGLSRGPKDPYACGGKLKKSK